MNIVFADTFYWIAQANPGDEWHKAALKAVQNLQPVHIVTVDEVLAEFLTYFCQWGRTWRESAVKLTERVRANPNITVA